MKMLFNQIIAGLIFLAIATQAPLRAQKAPGGKGMSTRDIINALKQKPGRYGKARGVKLDASDEGAQPETPGKHNRLLDILAARASKTRAPVLPAGVLRQQPRHHSKTQTASAVQTVPTTRDERQQLKQIITTNKLPQISLEIYFDLNKATIRPDSYQLLINLGQALASKELRGARLLIGGHTDARGRADHNLALSRRRARAVRNFLLKFGIPPRQLIDIGFGEEQLKFTPGSNARNRRVQIVNLGKQG